VIKKVLFSALFSYIAIVHVAEDKPTPKAAPDFKNVTRILVKSSQVGIWVPRDEVMPVEWTEVAIVNGNIAQQRKVHGSGLVAFENDWHTLKEAWAKIRFSKKTEMPKEGSTEITFTRNEKCHARWEKSYEPNESYKRMLHVHCGKYKRMLIVIKDKDSIELDNAEPLPDDGDVQQLYKGFPQEYVHDDIAKQYEFFGTD
jgi:hypothetical protein